MLWCSACFAIASALLEVDAKACFCSCYCFANLLMLCYCLLAICWKEKKLQRSANSPPQKTGNLLMVVSAKAPSSPVCYSTQFNNNYKRSQMPHDESWAGPPMPPVLFTTLVILKVNYEILKKIWVFTNKRWCKPLLLADKLLQLFVY